MIAKWLWWRGRKAREFERAHRMFLLMQEVTR